MKNTIKVQLRTVKDVMDFVKESSTFEEDIDISSGRYIIDAKSIMGIFSLDLAKPINVEIHSIDELVCEDFKQRLAIYEVGE